MICEYHMSRKAFMARDDRPVCGKRARWWGQLDGLVYCGEHKPHDRKKIQ